MATEDSNRRATEDTEQKGYLIPRGWNWSGRVKLTLDFDYDPEQPVVLQVGDCVEHLDHEEARDIGQALLTLATAADWDENFTDDGEEQ